MDTLERFTSLSEALTGYNGAELHATGMVETYYRTLRDILGGRMVGELLSAWEEVACQAGGESERVQEGLRGKILEDPKLGPVTKNLVFLWYTGQWNQMPGAWRDKWGAGADDQPHIVSPEAYREGLVWNAIGAHPMGAKQQGYGAWHYPPSSDLPGTRP